MKKILIGIVSLLILASTIGLVMAVSEDTAQAKVTVNEHISITLTDPGTTGINFGALNPGSGAAEQDQTTDGAITVTVDEVTNTAVDILTSGTDFSKGAETIAISSVTESIDNVKGNGRAMSSTPTELFTNIGGVGSAVDNDIWNWIDVPSNFLTAGDYTTTFTYTATKYIAP